MMDNNVSSEDLLTDENSSNRSLPEILESPANGYNAWRKCAFLCISVCVIILLLR